MAAATPCLLSIDVGIRNLAYCVLSKELQIIKWGVIDCCPESAANVIKCAFCASKATHYLPESHDAAGLASKKHTPPFLANSPICLKHANKAKTYSKQQTNPYTLSKLTTMHKNHSNSDSDSKEWMDVCDMVGITPESSMRTVYDHMRTRICQPIVRQSAATKNLTEVIKVMAAEFRDRDLFAGVTLLLVENQIGPKAVRMKAIQEVINALGIFSGISSENIHGISSAHKLSALTANIGSNENEVVANSYSNHKSSGILRCKEWLTSLNVDTQWHELFANTKKKDDLADSFLQALWGIKQFM